MTITKTTINYAKARGLELELSGSVLQVYSAKNDAEYMFSLHAQSGQFFWWRNVSLPQAVKEELPAYYPDEKALRLMLAFVGKEITE